MTARGAQVTPIRGEAASRDRPIPKPRARQANVPVALGFGAVILIAAGAFAWWQFAGDADTSLIDVEEGSRIQGSNTRMRTGVERGEGRFTASLADDAPVPQTGIVLDRSGEDGLRARIAELEAALAEKSESPEVSKLIADLATAKGKVAQLEIQLKDTKARLAQAEKDYKRDLTARLAEQESVHEEAMLAAQAEAAQQIVALQEMVNLERAKLTEQRERMLAERERALRDARRNSSPVIVDRRSRGAAERPFGGSGVPADPASSLAQGATFGARLESAIDYSTPGEIAAIVAADVPSASGAKVLIPKGSRLRGRYRTDVANNDTRILIGWRDLFLPDGSATAIGTLAGGSGGGDPLVSTVWPNTLVSLGPEAPVTVFVAREITMQN